MLVACTVVHLRRALTPLEDGCQDQTVYYFGPRTPATSTEIGSSIQNYGDYSPIHCFGPRNLAASSEIGPPIHNFGAYPPKRRRITPHNQEINKPANQQTAQKGAHFRSLANKDGESTRPAAKTSPRRRFTLNFITRIQRTHDETAPLRATSRLVKRCDTISYPRRRK